MRIVLDDMPQDPDPVKPGSQGTFVDYDDAGDLLIDWDPIATSEQSITSEQSSARRGLKLIPGVDRYHVLNIDNSEEFEKYRLGIEPRYKELIAERQSLEKKTKYYEHLLSLYNDYEPYYKVHAEVSSKRGIAYYRAKKKHSIELMQYEVKRKAIKDAIEGTNKNITPGKWREELKKIDDSIGDIDKEFNKVCEELARIEVLEHNKKELKLFFENESHKLKKREVSIDRKML